jgi:septin family protein
MTNPDRRIILVPSTILILLVSAPLNLYPDLNIQNSPIYGQENDDGLLTSGATNNNSSDSSTNYSGIVTQDFQSFTITCSDFMKLFDTISALDIGDQVSEKKVNQTVLDQIEHIFNSYAGNCSLLDEYEFE